MKTQKVERQKRPRERMVGLDVELLSELRRNAKLRSHFLPFPQGLKIINQDMAAGVSALLSENPEDMRRSLINLKGNKHWDKKMKPNVQWSQAMELSHER